MQGTLDVVILAVIIGTLAAIVYSLRVLVLMERRIARIDIHLEALVTKVFQEERDIEHEERDIETFLGVKSKKKAAKKAPAKKKAKKKAVKKKRRR